MRAPAHKIALLTLIFLFPTISTLFAQNTDNGLWTSVEIKKKFKYGIALSLEEEYKMRDNFSNTDKLETTLDLSWKPLSFLKGGIAYCRIDYNHPGKIDKNPPIDEPQDYWELRHRYIAYLIGSYDIGRFSLSLKEKFQQTYRMGVDSTKSDPIKILRTKVEASYNIKGLPISPYVSVEAFYSLNEPNGNYPSTTKMFSENRYAVGLEYSVLKNLDVELGYLHCVEQSWDDDALGHNIGGFLSEYTNVLTIGLNYSF